MIEILKKTPAEDTITDCMIMGIVYCVILLGIWIIGELIYRLEIKMDEKYRKRCFNCNCCKRVRKPGKDLTDYYECIRDGRKIGYVDALKNVCEGWVKKKN